MIYTYYCEKCKLKFDVQRIIENRDKIISCPQCTSNDIHRLVTRPAPPQFKVGGFYQTDYKGNK